MTHIRLRTTTKRLLLGEQKRYKTRSADETIRRLIINSQGKNKGSVYFAKPSKAEKKRLERQARLYFGDV